MSSLNENQRAEMAKLYEAIGLCEDIDCTPEENEQYRQMLIEGKPLPKVVYRYKKEGTGEYVDVFYTRKGSELSEAERAEYIQLKQFAELRTIKRCVIFFVVLAAIPLAAAAFITLAEFFGGIF